MSDERDEPVTDPTSHWVTDEPLNDDPLNDPSVDNERVSPLTL